MRNLRPFALERFFATWEFAVEHLLCASDVESYPVAELLSHATPELRDAWDRLRLGYVESRGTPPLRAAIAELYDHASADDVLVTVGAEEAIFLAMHALLGPGDHAVVMTPAYQSLHEVARSIGADVTELPLDPGNWSLDPARLAASMRPTTRVVVLNFPHSPTGALPRHEEFLELARIVDAHGAVLFSDEVYRLLEHDGAAPLPAAVDVAERGVSLGVMSKSFAMPGLRIGWLASRDRALLDRIATLKDYTTICAPAPSELLATMALRSRDHVLARSRAIVAANLALLDAFFTRQVERVRWVRPRGGSVAFPELLHHDADALAERLVRARGVLLLPGSHFGVPGRHFRLGYGRADLPVALDRFEEFLVAGR